MSRARLQFTHEIIYRPGTRVREADRFRWKDADGKPNELIWLGDPKDFRWCRLAYAKRAKEAKARDAVIKQQAAALMLALRMETIRDFINQVLP